MCNQRKKGLSDVLTPNTLAYFCCWCEIESVLPPNPCTLPGPQLRRRHVFQGQVTRPCWLVGELDWGGGFPILTQHLRGSSRAHSTGCCGPWVSTFWYIHVYTCGFTDTHTYTHKYNTSAGRVFRTLNSLCSLCPSFSTANKHIYTHVCKVRTEHKI